MIRLSFSLLLLTLTLWGASAGAGTPEQSDSRGILLSRMTEDFGTIRFGDKRSTVFPFTAEADVVVIFSAATNCDCTTAAYPRKPLHKGAKESIRVDFDARNLGYFHKTVTVKYIAGGKTQTVTLIVSGTVAEQTSPK